MTHAHVTMYSIEVITVYIPLNAYGFIVHTLQPPYSFQLLHLQVAAVYSCTRTCTSNACVAVLYPPHASLTLCTQSQKYYYLFSFSRAGCCATPAISDLGTSQKYGFIRNTRTPRTRRAATARPPRTVPARARSRPVSQWPKKKGVCSTTGLPHRASCTANPVMPSIAARPCLISASCISRVGKYWVNSFSGSKP